MMHFLLLLVVAFGAGFTWNARAETVLASGTSIKFDEGSLSVGETQVVAPLDGIGREVFLVPLSEIPARSVVGNHLLMRYLSKSGSPRERGLVVIDFKSTPAKIPNYLRMPGELSWDDNNFVKAHQSTLYFGVFVPRRLQFMYSDGRLTELKGPWMGPAKPEVYLSPNTVQIRITGRG
jgi:hypothetical protein